jgi:hypothetical protein
MYDYDEEFWLWFTMRRGGGGVGGVNIVQY